MTARHLQFAQTSLDPVLANDWHPVLRSLDLSPGTLTRSRLLDTDLVLWRSADTTVMAWLDRCPHRSVQLSSGTVVNDTLVCPYHGLAYDVTGTCMDVPAHPGYVPPPQSCATAFAVQERYGVIFVCLGTPSQDIAPFPEWDDPAFRTYLSYGHVCDCSGLRAIENFLDVAHLPFIHGGLLGDPNQAAIADYQVTLTDCGIAMNNIQLWQPDPDGTGKGGLSSYDYWTLRPLTVALRKHVGAGQWMVLRFSVTPVSEESCLGWTWGTLNYAPELSEADLIAFQDTVLGQDLANLATHNPKRLPLDPQLEFHLPSDRASLAYRKWLKQLGLRYGAIV
jgi:phenylpropionate dioxygenase-like ring-hydroxylating dioxygenase large terminal subunit